MKDNRRIKVWIIVLCISILSTIVESVVNKPEKQTITGYISPGFCESSEIEKVLKKLKIAPECNFKVSNELEGEMEFIIINDLNKISSDYELIARTPLVMLTNKQMALKLRNKLLKIESRKDDLNDEIIEEADVNFKKLMSVVIKDSWSKVGLNEKVQVFYPELDSMEGKILYNFLLIAANDGIYPNNEKELEKCKKYVNEFLGKSEVKGVNVSNRIHGLNSIGSNIYLLFESDLLVQGYSKEFLISYPSETVEKQIYFQGNTEVGKHVLEKIGKATFFSDSIIYRICKMSGYRDKEYNLWSLAPNFKWRRYNAVSCPYK